VTAAAVILLYNIGRDYPPLILMYNIRKEAAAVW
jgi:hypothetical protein